MTWLAFLATLLAAHWALPRRAWTAACIAERTGPTGGIPASEARQICDREYPDHR